MDDGFMRARTPAAAIGFGNAGAKQACLTSLAPRVAINAPVLTPPLCSRLELGPDDARDLIGQQSQLIVQPGLKHPNPPRSPAPDSISFERVLGTTVVLLPQSRNRD